MLKTVKNLLRQDQEPYHIPRRVQDFIPIRRIWNDGIFLTGNHFSKTFRFTDINYSVASEEDQKRMLEIYSALLNSLDPGSMVKITVNNRPFNQKTLEQSILMPMKGDFRDIYRGEYNQMMIEKSSGANGIIQEKYVTLSVFRKDIEEARSYFTRAGASLTARLADLGSRCVELDAVEKLRILHDFYRPGEENRFQLDLKEMVRLGEDFRDYICPDSMERYSDYLKLGETYCRVLFLKHYGSFIRDNIVASLTDIPRNLMLSIDIIPIPLEEAIKEVEKRLLGIETDIANWQRRQNESLNFSSIVPYHMDNSRGEARELMSDMTTRDQRMMQVVITMVLTANSKEQLDRDTEAVQSQSGSSQLAVLKFQQMDGLKTAVPIGVRKINAFRTLTTEGVAAFLPFQVQEIQEKGGIYFGENAISHNLILCNRENLLNQSAFLLGVPGSGKSFAVKELITFLLLNTEDDILICDPEGEFSPLVQALAGDISTVIRMAAGGKDRLNAMYMEEGYGDNNPIVEKSQFILSLIERFDDNCFTSQHRSIIDRCVSAVFREMEAPTLCDLREKLLQQPEEKAKEVALSLELYTTGSLDMFGHESNVDLSKRIISFDIHDMSPQLKPAGLLVITDTILNRVTLNWKNGKRTHVFLDEFHVVFENEYSGMFFNSAWRQFRKRGAYPTAITQNVDYLLDSTQARTMLSNSEFLIMLNQSPKDREKLADLLNISSEQMSFITDVPAGCGLIRYGSALIPFVNRFPKDTKLYQLMTTKPGEGVFGGQKEENNERTGFAGSSQSFDFM